MENDIIIGDRIRKIREDLKMSRETFSEMIDISDFFLGKIERGERSLSNNTRVFDTFVSLKSLKALQMLIFFVKFSFLSCVSLRLVI